MRLLLPGTAITLAVLALAGCLGSPAPEPVQPEQPASGERLQAPTHPVEAAPAEPGRIGKEVFPFSGKMTTGVGAGGVGYLSPTGSLDPHQFAFPVDAGAVAIVAELAWDNRAMDLDIALNAPSCDPTMGSGACVFADGGSPGAGDSPVRIVLQDPAALNETGEWRITIWAKSAVNVDFRTVVTVFYGLPPSADYTGLGS